MNLIKRGITGIVIVAVIAGCIILGYSYAGLLFLGITLMSGHEFAHIVRGHAGTAPCKRSALLSAALLYLSMLSVATLPDKTVTGVMAALWLISLMRMMIGEIYSKSETPVLNIAINMMPMLYIALPMALVPLLGLIGGRMTGTDYNGMLPLSVFIFIWCNDVGAYCVGCSIGRHKLFPRISPKKSWEGSIGGAVFAIGAALLLSLAFPARFGFMSTIMWLSTALVTVVAGTFGDLAESLIKRELGIKDSGSILPGHGGFLDRFDSSFMAVPAVTALLLFFL